MISLGVGGGVGFGSAGIACNIARGEGVCARTLYFCILYFKYMIESILYFNFSNTFPVLYLYFVFQILFKLCICILYFQYKLHVFDTTIYVTVCSSIIFFSCLL